MGQSFKKPGLKTLLAMVISVIPLTFLNVNYLNGKLLNTEELARERIFNLSKQVAGIQEKYLETSRNILLLISQLPEVQNPTDKKCSDLLATLLKGYPFYTNFGVIDLKGDLICTATPSPEPINLADTVFFNKTLQNKDFSIGEYRIGRVTGKEILSYGYPVKSADNKISGVVYATLSLDWLKELVARQELPEEGILLVLDRKGKILARSPDNDIWVGKSIPDKALLSTILYTKEGVVETDKTIDRKPYVYGFTSLAGSDDFIFLAMGEPKNTILEEIQPSLNANVLLLSGTSAVSVVLIFIIWLILRRGGTA